MCIIAVKPDGVRFSDQRIANMWNSNSHGAGIMYAENGEVKIVKGIMDLKRFYRTLDILGPSRPMVMHFRIKTHGEISRNMTHPFWIEDGRLAMVHNGIIPWLCKHTTEVLSDTAIYAQWLQMTFQNDTWAALNSKQVQERIRKHAGWSKFAFLHNSGKVLIINEESGYSEADGSWFSNAGYKDDDEKDWYQYYAGDALPKGWQKSKWFSSEADTDKKTDSSMIRSDKDDKKNEVPVAKDHSSSRVRIVSG